MSGISGPKGPGKGDRVPPPAKIDRARGDSKEKFSDERVAEIKEQLRKLKEDETELEDAIEIINEGEEDDFARSLTAALCRSLWEELK